MTLEDCPVVVTSRVQALEVTAGKETKLVQAGQSYRVSLDAGCGKHPGQPPPPPARSRFILIPLVAGGITIWPIIKAFESPDCP